MGVFVDWRCHACGKRWGDLFESVEAVREMEAQPCPACGASPTVEIPARSEKLNDMRVTTGGATRDWSLTPDGYFLARRAAALSFGQAARHLGITVEHLADIEDGNVAPNRMLLMRMREIYGVTFVKEK